ncbi:MAG: 3D (Asp-Asp-Asp) domain-containing protein [Psychromonas sp.]|jgi:3D (Asp-Asp-Asp) domain-containing protein|uniref:3D domain-containing protein n=1 Tax=Psychromonas sp. TaxID=1884585 RepID=UPI0039E6D81B
MSKLRPLLLITFVLLGTFNYSYAEVVTMKVSASAYNSTVKQTNSDPFIGAWGDRLVPGVKSIAVSRDLLKKGLSHNSVVKIKGFDGKYVVKDKMNKRWKNKIDIYMGLDKKAAKNWGVRKVTITFNKKVPKK